MHLNWRRETPHFHLWSRIAIPADHRRSKPISLSQHGFDITRLLGGVPQRLPELADSRIDTVVNVDEDVLSPEVLGDLIARHQLPASLH